MSIWTAVCRQSAHRWRSYNQSVQLSASQPQSITTIWQWPAPHYTALLRGACVNNLPSHYIKV